MWNYFQHFANNRQQWRIKTVLNTIDTVNYAMAYLTQVWRQSLGSILVRTCSNLIIVKLDVEHIFCLRKWILTSSSWRDIYSKSRRVYRDTRYQICDSICRTDNGACRIKYRTHDRTSRFSCRTQTDSDCFWILCKNYMIVNVSYKYLLNITETSG